MKIIICDVGNAASTFVTSQNGNTMMIDCGNHPDKPNPIDTFIQNQKWLGAKSFGPHLITLLHITHPDDDHVRNAKNVFEKLYPYLVACVHSEEFSDGAKINLDYKEFIDKKYRGIPTSVEWDFSTWTWSIPIATCRVEASLKQKERNNSSIIRFIQANGVGVLFCGDLETPGWDYLIATRPDFAQTVQGRVNILIAPHHGHESGFSEKLFDVIGDVDVVILSKGSEANIDGTDVSTKYSEHARGHVYCPDNDKKSEYKGKVLTTRSNGTIFIDATEKFGTYTISTDKASPNHTKLK